MLTPTFVSHKKVLSHDFPFSWTQNAIRWKQYAHGRLAKIYEQRCTVQLTTFDTRCEPTVPASRDYLALVRIPPGLSLAGNFCFQRLSFVGPTLD